MSKRPPKGFTAAEWQRYRHVILAGQYQSARAAAKTKGLSRELRASVIAQRDDLEAQCFAAGVPADLLAKPQRLPYLDRSAGGPLNFKSTVTNTGKVIHEGPPIIRREPKSTPLGPPPLLSAGEMLDAVEADLIAAMRA
jgi:hypothetical protein